MANFKPIHIDHTIPYGENLVNAINAYWRAKVCRYEGLLTDQHEGKTIMPSKNGMPIDLYVLRIKHPDVIRCRRAPGTNNWVILDGDNQRRTSTVQHRDRAEDTRQALSRRAQIRRRIEESYRRAS